MRNNASPTHRVGSEQNQPRPTSGGTASSTIAFVGFILLVAGCPETNELPRHRRLKTFTFNDDDRPWKVVSAVKSVSPETMAYAKSVYRPINLPECGLEHDYKSRVIHTREELDEFLGRMSAEVFSNPRKSMDATWNVAWHEDIDFEHESLVLLRHGDSGSVRVRFGAPSFAKRRLTIQVIVEAYGDLQTDDFVVRCFAIAVDRSKVDNVVLSIADGEPKAVLALGENRRDPMPPPIDCGHVPSEAEVNMFCGTELHPSSVTRDAWGVPTCSRRFDAAENRGKRHSGIQGIRWEVVTWTNTNRDLIQLYDLHLRESMAPTTRMSTKFHASPRHLARHRDEPTMSVTAIEDLGHMASAISPVAKDSDAGHEIVFVKGRYFVVLKSARHACTLGNLTALAHRISKRLEER